MIRAILHNMAKDTGGIVLAGLVLLGFYYLRDILALMQTLAGAW